MNFYNVLFSLSEKIIKWHCEFQPGVRPHIEINCNTKIAYIAAYFRFQMKVNYFYKSPAGQNKYNISTVVVLVIYEVIHSKPNYYSSCLNL